MTTYFSRESTVTNRPFLPPDRPQFPDQRLQSAAQQHQHQHDLPDRQGQLEDRRSRLCHRQHQRLAEQTVRQPRPIRSAGAFAKSTEQRTMDARRLRTGLFDLRDLLWSVRDGLLTGTAQRLALRTERRLPQADQREPDQSVEFQGVHRSIPRRSQLDP